jgi:hypothetical protein
VHCHLAGPILKHTFVFVTKSLDELIIGLGINAGYHAIINMEATGLLFSIDHLIANTRVIRVQFEAGSFEGVDELVVVKQAGDDCEVNSIQTLQNQQFFTFLVQTNKLFVA